VVALSAGLGIWGVINLLEGCGNYNPSAILVPSKEVKWQTTYKESPHSIPLQKN